MAFKDVNIKQYANSRCFERNCLADVYMYLG